MTARTLRSTTAAPPRRGPSLRLLWMLPAGFALLAGLNAGLLLIGLPAPVTSARLSLVHGMLLVIGFVATLVSLERATALGHPLGFAAPGLLGAGAVLLVIEPVPLPVAQAVLVTGTAAFTLVYVPLWRRQYDAATLTQLLAAGLACAATVLWLGGAPMPRVLPWIIGFVVLTIAAERVELARITMGPRAGGRLLAQAVLLVAALLVTLAVPRAGTVLLGLVLALLVAWLLRHDVARHTVKQRGATRYMAACILAGYLWLSVAALVLIFGDPESSFAYDALAHAVFLGYVMSMIMGHASTILPAVLRIALPYRPAFWAPVALLQVALVVRLGAGDLFGWPPAWRLGGALGVAALLLFLLTALASAILGPPPPREPKGRAR